MSEQDGFGHTEPDDDSDDYLNLREIMHGSDEMMEVLKPICLESNKIVSMTTIARVMEVFIDSLHELALRHVADTPGMYEETSSAISAMKTIKELIANVVRGAVGPTYEKQVRELAAEDMKDMDLPESIRDMLGAVVQIIDTKNGMKNPSGNKVTDPVNPADVDINKLADMLFNTEEDNE